MVVAAVIGRRSQFFELQAAQFLAVAADGLGGGGQVVEGDDDVLQLVVLVLLHDEGRNRQHQVGLEVLGQLGLCVGADLPLRWFSMWRTRMSTRMRKSFS